jgi:hypothetical protein
MLNTYVIEGGIGKCTAFTALIPKLADKAGEGIQIYTPYIDVFAFNPDVAMAYEQSLPLNDPRIMASDNVLYCEPYKSNFALGKQHLIESYCELFGVDYEPTMVPKLYTTHLRERADEWLEKNGVTGKYIMVQFSGGQTPVGWNAGNNYFSHNPGATTRRIWRKRWSIACARNTRTRLSTAPCPTSRGMQARSNAQSIGPWSTKC